jgi:hypothetical protein
LKPPAFELVKKETRVCRSEGSSCDVRERLRRRFVMGALLNLLHGLLVVIGRIFGQVLSGKREHDNRRRDLRVPFLVEAWRCIERAANRGGPDEMRGLEQAIADVQLFGTPSQAEQAASVARSMNAIEMKTSATQMKAAVLDDLLESLRVDLRDEMRLGRANSRLVHLHDPQA